MTLKLFALSLLAVLANAHMAAFHKAMYCLNGTVAGQDNENNNDPVSPLWMLSTSDWWFHHFNLCDQFPPAEGDFLELPAGGSFTVELADNRAVTSLSYNGQYTTEWGDGQNHPEDYSVSSCITSPNMHTQNQSMAAGTAFAISYQSDLSQVTMENLVVFSVAYNTPWKRVTTYSVPQAMPACPTNGCTCAWVWIPNGCGEPNIYMEGFKCMVTGATSTVPVASAKPPVWCEEDQSSCTQGAKQILIWNQASGNNIVVSGSDQSGHPKSPAYNSKCGFSDGAQNNIFATSSSSAVQGDVIPAAVAGTESPISSSATSTGAASYTTTSSTTGAAGNSTSIPVSSTASTGTTYYTTTSSTTGVAGNSTSIPTCSMPPSNSSNAPASTASFNSSCTITSSTANMTSTLYTSSSAFSPSYSMAPSNLSSKSTSPSMTASPSSSETCHRPKRMVHKRSRHP